MTIAYRHADAGGVKIFYRFSLGWKVSVLPVHVAVLVVNEEVIEVVVLGEVTFELFCDRLRPFQLRHAHQLSQSFVHWINSDSRRLQSIYLFIAG